MDYLKEAGWQSNEFLLAIHGEAMVQIRFHKNIPDAANKLKILS